MILDVKQPANMPNDLYLALTGNNRDTREGAERQISLSGEYTWILLVMRLRSSDVVVDRKKMDATFESFWNGLNETSWTEFAVIAAKDCVTYLFQLKGADPQTAAYVGYVMTRLFRQARRMNVQTVFGALVDPESAGRLSTLGMVISRCLRHFQPAALIADGIDVLTSLNDVLGSKERNARAELPKAVHYVFARNLRLANIEALFSAKDASQTVDMLEATHIFLTKMLDAYYLDLFSVKSKVEKKQLQSELVAAYEMVMNYLATLATFPVYKQLVAENANLVQLKTELENRAEMVAKEYLPPKPKENPWKSFDWDAELSTI